MFICSVVVMFPRAIVALLRFGEGSSRIQFWESLARPGSVVLFSQLSATDDSTNLNQSIPAFNANTFSNIFHSLSTCSYSVFIVEEVEPVVYTEILSFAMPSTVSVIVTVSSQRQTLQKSYTTELSVHPDFSSEMVSRQIQVPCAWNKNIRIENTKIFHADLTSGNQTQRTRKEDLYATKLRIHGLLTELDTGSVFKYKNIVCHLHTA